MTKKGLFLFLTVLLFFSVSVAQPQPPHRVYGDVTSDDISTSGLNVSFRNSTNFTVVSGETDSQGVYDVYLSGLDTGERAYLFLEDENTTEYVSFSQGASEGLDCHLDTSTYTCVEDDSGGSDEEDNQDNDPQEEDDPGDGDDGGGTGGGGSGGGFGGGGFAPASEDEPVEVSSELVNGEAEVIVGEVDEDQPVEITVSESDYIQGLSFTAGESGNVSVNLEGYEEMPGNYGAIEGKVFRYFLAEVEGIETFTNMSLGYQVPESWLIERNLSVENVSSDLSQGASWGSVENKLIADGLTMNSFEAVSEDTDGLFAVKVPEQNETDGQQRPENRGVEVQSLSVTPSQDGENAEVTAIVVNNNEKSVNDSLTLTRDGEEVESWQVSLEPGETRELSFSTNLDGSDSQSFSLGGEAASLDTGSDDESGGLPLLLIVAGGGILLLITVLLAYIYLVEYRRASELDETIRSIEESGERVNQEMENVRNNIERLRRHVTGSNERNQNQ